MKLKDIHVGSVYQTSVGPFLVLDIGKFSATTQSDIVREVQYKSLHFQVGRSWYWSNSSERNRVAGVVINRQSVDVLNGSALHTLIAPSAFDKEYCLRSLRIHTEREITKQASEQHAAFIRGLSEILDVVTGSTSDVSNARNDAANPFAHLSAGQDAVWSMLTLWLRWHESRGMDVNGSDPGDLAEHLKDLQVGIRQSEQRLQRMRDEVEAAIEARWAAVRDIGPKVIEVVS